MTGSGADPGRVSTRADLVAELSAVLEGRSLRDLAKALEKQREDDQQLLRVHRGGRAQPVGAAPSKTTLGKILSPGGGHLPSEEVLVALLRLAGITTPQAQQPWREALNRARASAQADHSAESSQPAAGPYRRRRLSRTSGVLLVVALVVVSGFVGVVAFIRNGMSSFTTTMGCVPATCAAAGPTLALIGQASGRPPSGYEPHILLRVESTGRWYTGPKFVPAQDGKWSSQVGIGNSNPQSKDRLFTICTYLLPVASVDSLSERLRSYKGEGLPVEELPPDRTELTCVSAVRLANS